jgi:hypothetical protein
MIASAVSSHPAMIPTLAIPLPLSSRPELRRSAVEGPVVQRSPPVQQLLSREAPPFPLSSRPERSVVERSAVRPSAFSVVNGQTKWRPSSAQHNSNLMVITSSPNSEPAYNRSMADEKEKKKKAVKRLRKAVQKAVSKGVTEREISRTVDASLVQPKKAKSKRTS